MLLTKLILELLSKELIMAGVWIYIYTYDICISHQKLMKSYDKDVLFERTSMEKYLYIYIFMFITYSFLYYIPKLARPRNECWKRVCSQALS